MVSGLASFPLGNNAVRVSWQSDRAICRVFVDGRLFATTTARSIDLTLPNGGLADVEVIDEDTPTPGPAFPAYVLLQWFTGDLAAVGYRVEQLVGGVWAVRGRIDHVPQTYLSWRSRTLADDTTHAFRVTGISAAGNAGPPLAVSVLMVRRPDPPDVSFGFDPATSTVTIG